MYYLTGTAATTNTMEALITQFTTASTSIWSQVETVCTTIVGQPLLLFTTAFLFVGGCIGIFGRVLSRR